jgi:hypothetical protein
MRYFIFILAQSDVLQTGFVTGVIGVWRLRHREVCNGPLTLL